MTVVTFWGRSVPCYTRNFGDLMLVILLPLNYLAWVWLFSRWGKYDRRELADASLEEIARGPQHAPAREIEADVEA